MGIVKNHKNEIVIIAWSLLLPGVIFMFSLCKTGERDFGVVETIHGIPYPKIAERTIILEHMAHADMYLKEPVFAKRAVITVSFDPKESETISLGVRDNEFWLSYIQYPLYVRGSDTLGQQTKTLSIPLSTSLQDKDRSVDFMFFTESTGGNVEWSLGAFHANVELVMPTLPETKAYIKSILTRERAL